VYTNLTKLRTYSGSFEDLGLVFQVRPWLLGCHPGCCSLEPAVAQATPALQTVSELWGLSSLVRWTLQQAEQENEWGNGSVLVDLKDHGGDIPVSKDNVDEYIQVQLFLGSRWPVHLHVGKTGRPRE
jgi:hypothetical protein